MEAITIRNKAWEKTDRIPGWVNINEVNLDQYNTLPTVADYCWDSFQNILKKEGEVLENFNIIEPSAGIGVFYDLLPKRRRVGIDVRSSEMNIFKKIFSHGSQTILTIARVLL